MQWPTRKVWRYQRGNQNCKSHDGQYNDLQERFEDIKGVIRTVNNMTGNTMTNTDYHFDIFKLFLLVIVLPVMWFTVLITPLLFSNFLVCCSLVLYVCFVDRCLSFCTFSFDHCVVCSSSMYGFWLLLWYLQTFLVTRSLVLCVCFIDRCLS
jgi:hypothetical protein